MYKILLVDDYQVFRKTVKRMSYWKTSTDFEIAYEASDGKSALEILENEKVDLVITDIKMPIMDGIGLLKEINNRKYLCPVILLSEYTEFEYAREGLVLGAFDYIIKPITPEKLEEVLNRILPKLSDNSKQAPLSLEIHELINCLKISSENSLAALKEFLQKSQSLSQNSALQLSIIYFENLEKIYAELIGQYKWLENLLPYLEEIEDQLRSYDSVDSLTSEFSEFIQNINSIISYYGKNYSSDTINTVRDYILASPYSKLSLSDLADHFFINKTYLSHAFKQETGVSIVDFITHYKIDIARVKLLESSEPVSEIALDLGYDDAKYFSKIFKNIYSISPAEYRKRGLVQ